MAFSPHLIDTDKFWRLQSQVGSGSFRNVAHVDLANRPDKRYPWLPVVFNTTGYNYRAVPYIQHMVTEEENLHKAFFRHLNALNHAHVVSWVSSLANEMNVCYEMPYLFDNNTESLSKQPFLYYARDEHGDNGNPNDHGINSSEKKGILVQRLCNKMNDLFNRLREEHVGFWTETDKKSLEDRMVEEWKKCQNEIINFHYGMHHNWNPGMTADLEKTMDLPCPSINIAKLEMNELLDEHFSQRGDRGFP